MKADEIKRIQEMIERHQNSVKNQDEIYRKNFESKVRNIPSGAGLQSDDLSKVASVETIGNSGDTASKLSK